MLLGVMAVFSASLAQAGFVYETEKEFLTTGDFNGDEKLDLAIVDKATGRVRLGYRISEDFFSSTDWRSGGLKDVTGVAVGRLRDAKRDSLSRAIGASSESSVPRRPCTRAM